MLLVPLLGTPPYGYFDFSRLAVAAFAASAAWLLYQRAPEFIPVSIVLAVLGVFELFVKLSRVQRQPYDWATVAAFAVTAVVAAGKRSKTIEQIEAEMAEIEANMEALESEDLNRLADAVFERIKADGAMRGAEGEYEGRDLEAERRHLAEELRRSLEGDGRSRPTDRTGG